MLGPTMGAELVHIKVRTHGVAYFGFASDDSKRAEQIRDLKKLSEQTEATRERVTKERDQKASQLKERLRKVRDRKRARLGLPPKKDETESEEQLSPSQSDRSDVSSGKKPKVSDEDDNEEEEEERRRSGDTGGAGGGSDSKSKAEMRPWDFGKPGVYGPKPINFDQLDATWLKDRREDRSSEFAPPTTYYTKTKLAGPTSTVTSLGFGGSSSSRSSSSGYNYSNFVREKSRVETGMKEEKKTGFSPNTGYRGGGMSLESQNLPGKKRNVIGRKDDDDDDDDDDEELKDPHYGGTSSINQYSSDERALSGRGVRAQSPIPIKDELLPADDPTKRRGGESCSWKGGKGAEIPPPPTFEYYHGEGGSGGKGRGQKSGALPGDDSVKDAISAGLRALREQFEMKQTAKGGPDVPGSDSGY
ncbi:unnamed protein product [Allacma fusca]|uniref:Uncharacterized protein n=1 Tax=Allacma fusca TaxID=39272 RepID=A0A8J2JJI4_9HEXA|nr:unnamed protein product [Allacma fusca]